MEVKDLKCDVKDCKTRGDHTVNNPEKRFCKKHYNEYRVEEDKIAKQKIQDARNKEIAENILKQTRDLIGGDV